MADSATVLELIDVAAIDLAVEPAERDGAILALARRLQATGRVIDAEAVTAAALEREAIGSTNVGFGVAIPHAKSEHVARAGFAFGRRAGGIRWAGEAVADAGGESTGDHDVDLVFLIASPAKASDDHLRILATLARALMHEEFRDALRGTGTAEETLSLLAERLSG